MNIDDIERRCERLERNAYALLVCLLCVGVIAGAALVCCFDLTGRLYAIEQQQRGVAAGEQGK